ncbi:L-threonylcarbamoyladenylate synthase [Heliomarina baculiformis]|uniref:L-threonylcarbamoyladenylate synthase n=1 Tax=Heliomarina baculiformis TaxID=2872036 RepID=UPI001EE3827C|nr:L-threonylcarbamoyladenylate synthase [Heliomarina baculiformis]
MNSSSTLMLGPSATDLARAADLLRQGACVAFPTETVYGLGADATNGRAVAGIYEAKGRPSFNPLIVHAADVATAQRYVGWSDEAETLARAFWPGPLTLVLPLRADADVSPLVTAGLDTLAIRVPAHPTARALLKEFGGVVAAPSANPSGRISATTADHVRDGLGGRIAAIVDDGRCEVGLESTILGFGDDRKPVLLRPGGLAVEEIEGVLGGPVQRRAPSATLNAPGQMLSHYAPKAAIRLNAPSAERGEILIGFGEMPCDLNLSPEGDLAEAAANLFGHLHLADRDGRPIAIAPIPKTGLGLAINDRLARAAAPRD